jgi:hypothetical protein
MAHEPLASDARRSSFLRRVGGRPARDRSRNDGAADSTYFVCSDDGTSGLPPEARTGWRSAGSNLRREQASLTKWEWRDELVRRWFDDRPLLLPYIAFMVTLELFVILVKL